MTKIFYVYEHWRPDTDLPFYVGKGKGRRAYMTQRQNAGHRKVADHLATIGMCIEVRMVANGLTETEAFTVERARIAFWRSACVDLANQTDGGEGFSGFVRPLGIRQSEQAKKKLSEARKGMRFSLEHRANLAKQKVGKPRKPFTDETLTKMRAAATLREAAKRAKLGAEVRRNSKLKETV